MEVGDIPQLSLDLLDSGVLIIKRAEGKVVGERRCLMNERHEINFQLLVALLKDYLFEAKH